MKSLRLVAAASISWVIAALVLGCASDSKMIENKISLELEGCRAASGDTYEVRFEFGAPYLLAKSLCDTKVTDVVITDQINATAKAGPYIFSLRKNTKDQRWSITRVSWPELDQVRSIKTFDTISDADLKTADGLLATAEKKAPRFAEIKLTRLELLLMQRKRANKTGEPDRSTLGVAAPYYEEAVKAAEAQKNPDLNLQLRLLVIGYYDRYRDLAHGSSEVSESASDWEVGAIKAIQNDADAAKAAKDDKTYEAKLAEIEQRQKELEANKIRRQEEAKIMTALTVALTKRECDEIAKAKGLTPSIADLKDELNGYAGACAK